MGDSSARQTPDHRLDSWKEIAAFFGRDERTVRRWEKERGLPAHRVPGGARGGVFAYTVELREWLKGRAHELDAAESDPGLAAAANQAGKDSGNNEDGFEGTPSSLPSSSLPPSKGPTLLAPVIELRPPAAALPSRVSLSPVSPPRSYPPLARIVAWLAPLLVVAVLIVALSVSRRDTRFKNALAAPHSPNAEAQDLYLKGEYHRTKRTPEDLNKAVDYFTQSIVKDPSYARAYVGLADCYNLLREFSVMPPEEAYPRALAAAQKAVELDDTLAAAHTSLAFSTFYWNWDSATAEHEYRRALELDPNSVQGHHWYATFLLASARFPEALDQIEQARKLDPSSTTILADKGLILFDSGRKSEAFALLKQLASTDSALATTHSYLAKIYLDRKDYAHFLAESKQSAQLRHDEGGLAIANAAEQGFSAGGLDGMRESRLPLQKEMLDRGLGSAYDVAATCALLGRKEEALQYLQVAYDKREIGMLYLNRNPDFTSLRADSAYQEIAQRVSSRLSPTQQP
jgi:Tfp pilus assembly protein PilF